MARSWAKLGRRSAGVALLGAGAVALALSLASPAAAQASGNPTLEPWTTSASLPEGRSRTGAVYANGYLYVVGGVTDAGTTSTVLFAPVNPNGTVGTWQATTPLPAPRRTVNPVVWNGYLYLIGGNDGGAFQSTSYYAPINPNGTLGAWQTTTPLPQAQTSHATLVNNGYIYVVGGNTGTTCITTVRYAPINPNGTLGSWTTTNPLPGPRCGNIEAVTIANGFMYSAGGYNNADVVNAVYYAPINANGSLGTWQTSTNSLTVAREYNGLEVINGYLYAIGGQASVSGGATASVEVAALNANGTVGPFSATTSLPGPRGELASEMVANRLYAIGGGTGSSGANPQASTYVTQQAPVDAVPPTVSITAPANGATLSGTVQVSASASDNIGVAGVQFLLDGAPLGAEDTSAPYSVSWNTATATNGPHTLTARARDVSGNLTTSAAVNVTTSNSGNPTLLAAYGMETGAGATLVDSSSNGNDAALTSGTWTTAGRYGNAVTFNGTTTRARAEDNVTLGSAWTLEAWVNNPGNQAWETILTVGETRDLYLESGVLAFYSGNATATFGTVPTGSWQHVALTYDGTTLRAYLNGNPLGAPQPANLAPVTAPLQLGAWIFGGANVDYFSGTLDEVRVYSRALSQTEVQTDRDTPVTNPPADTTPPVVSNPQPSGALPPGTTQTSLQVTTNEAATCRYSTTPGTAYGAMTSTFSTTGGTNHATTVTGLTNGGSYAFYVRCQDPAGNATTSDVAITFTVANPDGVSPTVTLTAPAAGTVSGTVNVTANASDNVGVVGVQFLLDGNPLGAEDTSAPYSVSWDTTGATNGPHTLAARARDAAGNQTTSAPVTVTVSNSLPGPLVAYGFEEGNGTTTASTPSGPAGTITSGTWTPNGRYGNAITFNGNATRVRANANVALGNAFTMEAWINNPTIQTYETIVTVGSDRDLYLQTGQLRFDTGPTFVSFGNPLPTNTWVHVAVTYDGTTMRAYVNGQPYGNPQTLNLGAVNAPLQVGAWIQGNNNYDFFSGTIDEVRVYGRALSLAEIQADMNTPITEPVTPEPDDEPPAVTLTAPGAGTVSGTVDVAANASDNVGVVGVQFLLDGNPLGAEDTSAPYSVSWDTLDVANGTYELRARARDAAGNQTTSAPVTVTVSNSGLLVAYGFNEGAGGTAVSTPPGQNATITSGTWAAGRYGSAITFNGTTSRVRTDANLSLPNRFTFEAWINNPTIQAYETIITVGSNRDLYLQNGQLRFDTGPTFVSFGNPLPTNTWVHVAVTYDGTTMRAYVNGQPYGNPQTLNLGAVNAPLQVGAWIQGNNNYDFFSGTIDEVRVYGRALSQAEIQADMNTPI